MMDCARGVMAVVSCESVGVTLDLSFSAGSRTKSRVLASKERERMIEIFKERERASQMGQNECRAR